MRTDTKKRLIKRPVQRERKRNRKRHTETEREEEEKEKEAVLSGQVAAEDRCAKE